jgi:ATP-dependent DNA helicase RecQ
MEDAAMQRNFIESSTAPDIQKRIEHQKLNALLGLCEAACCRRQVILEYFGDSCPPCNNCDTCQLPPETFDGTVAAQKALSCVYRTDQRFGVAYLTEVLLGSAEDERIITFGHDRISTFGIGKEYSKAEWQSIFRQLVAQNLLVVDAAGHGGLKMTPQGQAFLKEKKTLRLRKYAGKIKLKVAARLAQAFDGDVDQGLFAALKAARLSLSKAQNVPPYVIFHDKTLYEMAAHKPSSPAELLRINGVGERKMERYGQIFLDIIWQYESKERAAQ